MSIPAKPFYMIRHGETEANAARIMAGSIDSPLTENGRLQAYEAQKAVEALRIKPVAIFHSHLSRARDTAMIINENLGLPSFEDSDLAEIHAGDLEGASYEECVELFNGWPTIPNGESPDEFFSRVKRGKSRAIEKFNEPILIVCHGGVMRAFGDMHGLQTPGKFKNAHLYEFQPTTQKSNFPWNVFDYEICPKTENLIKSRATIYDSASADKMAS